MSLSYNGMMTLIAAAAGARAAKHESTLLSRSASRLTSVSQTAARSAPNAAPATVVPSGIVYLGRPAELVPGRRYRVRGRVSALEGLIATPAKIRDYLQRKGFTNVSVWTSANALPGDWPAAERAGNLFVEGVFYQGAPGPADWPKQVDQAWYN